jgi:hypothetical protein
MQANEVVSERGISRNKTARQNQKQNANEYKVDKKQNYLEPFC